MGHRWVAEARQLHTRKVPRRNKSRPTRTTPRRFGTKLSQHTPRTACAVQNSPSTSRTAPLPVQNSPSSPEMARFGAFSTCRESFVPFSPPRSRAGRILYRTQGRDGASHDSTPGPTCVEDVGGTGGYGRIRGDAQSRTSTTWPHWYGGRRRARRARLRCPWAVVEPGRSTHKQQQHPAQANFACNSPTTRIDTRSKTAEYQRSDFNS